MKRDLYSQFEIIQVMSAPPGWQARYIQDDKSWLYDDVVCFALARELTYEVGTRLLTDTGKPTVYAMVVADGNLEIANETSNFDGICGPGDYRSPVKEQGGTE